MMKGKLCNQRALKQLRTRLMHISDCDSEGKTQHRRARIHPVPNLRAGRRRDKSASSSAAKKNPYR